MKKKITPNLPSFTLCLVLGLALLTHTVIAQIKAESIVMSMTDMGVLVVSYEIDKKKIKPRERFTIEALHILEGGQLKTTIPSEDLSGTLEISRHTKGRKSIKYKVPDNLMGNQVKLEYKSIDRKQTGGNIKKIKLWSYIMPGLGHWSLEKAQTHYDNNQISLKRQSAKIDLLSTSILAKDSINDEHKNDTPILAEDDIPDNHKNETKPKFIQWLPTLISLLSVGYGIGKWKDANNKSSFTQSQRDQYAKQATGAFAFSGTIYTADMLHLFIKNRKFVKKQKKKHHYKSIQ